jgi:putative molybdopterin biosynthesis protein
VRDLTRHDVRLVNRQRGAGTRLLLHHALRAARVDPHAVLGWEREVATHAGVAAAIAAGSADVGPGTRAAAAQAGLDFRPIGEERYDLAIPRALFDAPHLRPLLDALHARAFRRAAAALPGYDVSRMGSVAARVQG